MENMINNHKLNMSRSRNIKGRRSSGNGSLEDLWKYWPVSRKPGLQVWFLKASRAQSSET